MSYLKPPERIWLQYHEPEVDGQVTWERDQIHDSDVEYQRTPPPEEAPVGEVSEEWLHKVKEANRVGTSPDSYDNHIAICKPGTYRDPVLLFTHPPQPPEGEAERERKDFVEVCSKGWDKEQIDAQGFAEWVQGRARAILAKGEEG